MSGFLNALGAVAQVVSGSSLVQIGSVTLKGFEVPETIPWGSRIERKDHLLPGGRKRIDNLGCFDEPISWEGKFYGADTKVRSEAIDRMLRAGKPVPLSWNGKRRLVLLTRFVCFDERAGVLCPYRIEMEVLPQIGDPTNGTQSALAQLLGSDVASSVTALTSAIGTVSNYVDASVSDATAIAAQVEPIAALVGAGGALSTAQSFLGMATTAVGNISSIAGAQAAIASTTSALTSASANMGAASAVFDDGLGNLNLSSPFSMQTYQAAAGGLGGTLQAKAYVDRALQNIKASS